MKRCRIVCGHSGCGSRDIGSYLHFSRRCGDLLMLFAVVLAGGR